MSEKPGDLIPVAETAEPRSEAALAKDVIDVYQSHLQTMWDKIALPLGPTVTARVFRSIILPDNRSQGSLRRYLDITERGISLRRLRARLGRAASPEFMNELEALLPQLCNALDSLACRILAGSSDHDSDGDTEPIAESVVRANPPRGKVDSASRCQDGQFEVQNSSEVV